MEPEAFKPKTEAELREENIARLKDALDKKHIDTDKAFEVAGKLIEAKKMLVDATEEYNKVADELVYCVGRDGVTGFQYASMPSDLIISDEQLEAYYHMTKIK